jgi:tetratricopeptide (TPR) repeat protein
MYRAFAYSDLHQYDKAVADYSKAIELDAGKARIWTNRGHAYIDLHQPDKALADFNKAIELDPKLAAAWSNRGHAYNRTSPAVPMPPRANRREPVRAVSQSPR